MNNNNKNLHSGNVLQKPAAFYYLTNSERVKFIYIYIYIYLTRACLQLFKVQVRLQLWLMPQDAKNRLVTYQSDTF